MRTSIYSCVGMCIVVIVMHDKGSSPSQFIPHNCLYMMVLQVARSCMGGSQKVRHMVITIAQLMKPGVGQNFP